MNRRPALVLLAAVAVVATSFFLLHDSRQQGPRVEAAPGAAVNAGGPDELPEAELGDPHRSPDASHPAVPLLTVPASPDSSSPEPLRLPPEYNFVFGEPSNASPLSLVHDRFRNEARDESWAAAMESGIVQAISHTEATSHITVEHVECRSTICEVAGHMPYVASDSEIGPSAIFTEDLGAGWWQGRINMGVGQHAFQDEQVMRFIIIVANSEVFLEVTE